MGIWRTSTAIIIGILMGVVGFMIYHQQTTLPMADLLGAQTMSGGGALSYQITDSSLILSNTNQPLSGTLSILISFDPTSISLLTGQVISNYDYSFGITREGSITIFVDGQLGLGQIMAIPLQGESSNLSIASPQLLIGDQTQSLSITRIE